MSTTLLYTNSTAQVGEVLLRNNVKSGTLAAVKDVSYTTLADLFDGEIYRDEFVFPNNNAVSVVSNQETVTNANTIPILTALKADGSAASTFASGTTLNSLSDNFGHIPPRPQQYSQSMMFFWSGTKDTSICLYACLMSEFLNFSSATNEVLS